MNPAKALAIMALPTVGSQMVVLIYNIADTWFIGRTNDPAMIAASNLALTVYLIAVSLANVFGVGGGSLMARLAGEQKDADAVKVVNYSVFASGISAAVFSVLTLIFMTPLMRILGSEEATLYYCKQYLFTTVVLGSIPTVLSMSMPQLLRNAGYSKEAGLGVAVGSILNVILDPLFMFVILPGGNEVLGAGIATMLSNYVSFAYFIYIFGKVRHESILKISFNPVHLEKKHLQSLYMVGVPAAVSIFLFDLVNIVINRLTATYGDHTTPVAAIGIVLKLERIPINTGLGICLGMVPLVAYNFGAGNQKRMARFSSLARWSILLFSSLCTILFFIFAEPLVGIFIKDPLTVEMGTAYLKMRCFALPFMMIGYHVINYMNAVNKGKVSFGLAILRHLILIIPIMLIMNYLWGINGLMWSQVIADVINAVIALLIMRYFVIRSDFRPNR
ncbi:MAG: cation transporter [Saccharofermentans sp.]|nr:cation transporter [Saccharofermentans sp.]